MYTESEFMDMSLQSRMSRINEEVAKHWLTKYAYDIKKCEISKRRPEIKRQR